MSSLITSNLSQRAHYSIIYSILIEWLSSRSQMLKICKIIRSNIYIIKKVTTFDKKKRIRLTNNSNNQRLEFNQITV